MTDGEQPLRKIGRPVQPKFESWIDRQIREAIERGEFDAIAGKPLPDLSRDDENWWIKQKLKDEDIRGALPGVLQLRVEIQELPQTLADVRTEDGVREILLDLNARIKESHFHNREKLPVVVTTVNVDEWVERWRASRENSR